MSVVSCDEIWEERTWDIDIDSGVREYTRTWRVRVTDHKDDPIAATITSVLPPPGSPYTAANDAKDLGAALRKYKIRQWLDDPNEYRATAFYSNTRSPNASPDNPFDFHTGGGTQTGDAKELDPLLRPPVINWGSLRFQRALPKDRTGKAFVNSAGQRFFNQPLADRTHKVLSITRNEASYNVLDKSSYEDKVNNVNWTLGGVLNTTFGPGKAKCEHITAAGRSELKKFFWEINYLFHIITDDDAWDKIEVLDEGMYQRDELGDGKLKLIVDPLTKSPVTSPVPLNLKGLVLPDADWKAGNYKYRDFRLYSYKDFNLLALP